MIDLANSKPREVRSLIRQNKFVKPTSGIAQGYTQANLAILTKELAYDFLLFAQRNPKPCPLLDVTELVGEGESRFVVPKLP